MCAGENKNEFSINNGQCVRRARKPHVRLERSRTLYKFYVLDLHLVVLVHVGEPHVLCILCLIRLGCPMIIGETGNVGTWEGDEKG